MGTDLRQRRDFYLCRDGTNVRLSKIGELVCAYSTKPRGALIGTLTALIASSPLRVSQTTTVSILRSCGENTNEIFCFSRFVW